MKFKYLLFLASFTAVIFTGCKPKKKFNVQLGMKIETPDRLAGIPLASTPSGGAELPPATDLSSNMPPVGNQGQQQSCVAWAVAYALKGYQEKLEIGQQYLFSPSFIYNQLNNGMNAPMYVTDALNFLSQHGVCEMKDMPYNEYDWVSKPSSFATENAKKFRIDYWRQVNVQDLKEVKAQISAGYPVVIGAKISNEFITDGREKKAGYIWNSPGEFNGAHALLITGYDDRKGAFKFMNSWGTEWGENGFGWVTYSLFPEVVMYGFVAKDAVTPLTNTIAENKPDKNKPDNNNNNNQNIPPENVKDVETYQPKENPTEFEKLNFKATNVQHNVREGNLGYTMKIEGNLVIPPHYGKNFQVVVHIYDSRTQRQVQSLVIPTFSDVNGYAAAYTQVYPIGESGYRGTWWVHIPYDAINTPRGTTSLYAIPTLFIDNFGVAFGERINFTLTK